MSVTLGNLPARVADKQGSELDAYFCAARGRGANDSPCCATAAGEMTKWFDTNYHYIVPEFTADTRFELNPERDRKSTRLNSSHVRISYAVFCLKKKKKK